MVYSLTSTSPVAVPSAFPSLGPHLPHPQNWVCKENPLFCSLIKPFSPMPCSDDGFFLLGTLCTPFGMCRGWGQCAVVLGTLSRGMEHADISFSLLRGAQFNRTINSHTNTGPLQLCHSDWRLHFVPEGTFCFGSSCGSSVALQGESDCSLPSPQLALAAQSTTGASL